MTIPATPEPSTIDNIVPDCCNIGVVFRTLLFVNGVVLAAILLRTTQFSAVLASFVEAAVIVEPACLMSLFALCGLRRAVRTIPAWGQRLSCALAPAAVTALYVSLLSSNRLEIELLTTVSPVKAMLVAALAGLVMQHYFELRTRAYSPAIFEARLQALQARIRPHFLFNSLNAVLSLIRAEPRRAESALEDLAELFRVLMRDARALTSLEDEIRLCKQYLSIEKIRLGDRLQVEWETSHITAEVLQRARVPALLLQPLLENAVHYGVEPAREPVLVRIDIARSIDRIEIAVVNPIPILMTGDKAPMPGNNMALANIRERLALLHDVEAQLTTAEVRGFFEVRVRFPYVKAD